VITREQVVAALLGRLKPLDFVNSFFEAGSVSFDADDELSDMDLVVDAEEGKTGDVFAEVEAALGELASFDHLWQVPEPAWHGYSQRFYHLAGTPDYFYIDFLVRADGRPPRLTEVELHGTPRVYFDKRGLTTPTHIDREELRTTIRLRLQSIRGSLPMLAAFARKEIRRGDAAAAMHYYQTGVLRPLCELVRMRHCPLRYNFGLRYLRRDVGSENSARLARLSFAGSLKELAEHVQEAAEWAAELVADLGAESPDS
jgi:hypothetical protein